MQRDAHSSYFFTLFQHGKVAATSEESFYISGKSNLTIIIEESYEPSRLASGKEETHIHEEKWKLLQDICSKREG